MHEYGLCEAIAETARQKAAGRPVARIRVQIGSLLEADADSMEMAYSLVTEGTELGGSHLEMVQVPADGRCRSCDRMFEASHRWDVCPECGSGNVAVQNGNGMVLEQIEYRAGAERAG